MRPQDVHPDIREAVYPPPRRVAILGASDRPGRPSNDIAGALLRWGYEVVPVNPHCATVLGLKAWSTLSDVLGPLDVVTVFRRSEQVRDHLEDILAAAPKVLWMQDGVQDAHVTEAAMAAGIKVISDDCIARRIAQWQSSET